MNKTKVIEMGMEVNEALRNIFDKFNENHVLKVGDTLECLAIAVNYYMVSQVQTKSEFRVLYDYFDTKLRIKAEKVAMLMSDNEETNENSKHHENK